MKILEKEFSLKKLLEFTTEGSDDVKIYNSCYTEAGSVDYILKKEISAFQPMYRLYHESDVTLSAVYSWDQKDEAVNLRYLRNFIKDNPKSAHQNLEYDFEDGFIYRNYSTAILTDEYLVLL